MLFVSELHVAGEYDCFGSRAAGGRGLAFADVPQQDAHGVCADLRDGESGDVHPRRCEAEKRVFVHAGKAPAAVVDVDAAVVEVAQGFGGEDVRGEEKSVRVGHGLKDVVERVADVLLVTGIGDFAVEAGISRKTGFRQRPEVAFVPLLHGREVGHGRDDGDFAESPGGQVADQCMAAVFVVDDDATGFRFGKAAVEQHNGAVAPDEAVDFAPRGIGRGDDDAVHLFRPE